MPSYTPDPSTFKSLAADHNLIPVYREISADLETPVSAYLKTAVGTHSFLFESVEGGENLARYSFLGTEPSEVLTTGAGTEHGEIDPDDQQHGIADAAGHDQRRRDQQDGQV